MEGEPSAGEQHEARLPARFSNHVVRRVHVARVSDHHELHLARGEQRFEARERDDVQVEPALHQERRERSREIRPFDQCNCWMTRHAPKPLPSRYLRSIDVRVATENTHE